MEQTDGAFPVRELSKVAVVWVARSRLSCMNPCCRMTSSASKTSWQDSPKAWRCSTRAIPGAEALFSGLAEADPAARAYRTNAVKLIDHPPEEWHGVWVITNEVESLFH